MSLDVVDIGGRKIGTGHECLVIAEVGQNHDGSLGAAHAYVDAIADAGADAVKFQTHIAAAESTPAEAFRVKFSRQDKTRYDYWQRMEWTPEQWSTLAEHAAERGLMFISSAFSEAAVDLLDQLDMPVWKVGSGELASLDLLKKMAQTGRPVLLSSGMSSWEELEAAVEILRAQQASFGLFQCTTAYPCPPEAWGLNILSQMRERFGCPVGLSDHSGNIYASLAAAALGANMIEVHVTFSKECFGPDVPASVTTQGLARLTEGVRAIGRSLSHPVDKDVKAEELSELRGLFSKSLVASCDLSAGQVIGADDIVQKKPGTGIPAARKSEFVGRTLAKSMTADELFREDDFVTDQEDLRCAG